MLEGFEILLGQTIAGYVQMYCQVCSKAQRLCCSKLLPGKVEIRMLWPDGKEFQSFQGIARGFLDRCKALPRFPDKCFEPYNVNQGKDIAEVYIHCGRDVWAPCRGWGLSAQRPKYYH